jgi:predicted DNA binding CopG/RHH family protein
MKLPEEHPPRRPGETAIYEEDPFELGKIDDSQLEVVEDFLPSPEELAKADQVVKVTIALSQESIDFFKAQAKQHNTSYQRMIRRLLDEYVQHQQTP